MLVESGVSMRTNVAVMPTPSFSGEGSLPAGSGFSTFEANPGTFSFPSFDSGEKFMPQKSLSSILSQTFPVFEPIGSIPETVVKKAGEIFSNSDGSCQVIEKAGEKPKLTFNLFENNDFRPVIFDSKQIVNEGPARVKISDTTNFSPERVLDKRQDTDLVKDLNQYTEIYAPEVKKKDFDLKVIQMSKIKKRDFTETVPTKTLYKAVEDILLTERAGYEVGKVFLEEQEQDDDNKQVEALEKSKKEEIEQILWILKQFDERKKEKEEKKDEDKKEMKENKNEDLKQKILSHVVDEFAQSKRKTTLREMISQVFKLARESKKDRVVAKNAARQIKEKQEHKSELLLRAGFVNVPDGSFQDAIDQVAELKAYNNSPESEIAMKLQASAIVDANPAVTVKQQQFNSVSDRDINRVTRHIR